MDLSACSTTIPGTTAGAGFNASNTSFSSTAGGNNNNNTVSSPGKYRVTGAMGKAHAPMVSIVHFLRLACVKIDNNIFVREVCIRLFAQ